VTYGLDSIAFTDSGGTPLPTGTCAVTPTTAQPPCNVQVQPVGQIHFNFSGVIDTQAAVGQYTFYARAHNAAGWGNIATCRMQIT
jgi:hypothetical protein